MGYFKKVKATYCDSTIIFATMADCSRFFEHESGWLRKRLFKKGNVKSLEYEGWLIETESEDERDGCME